MEISLLSNIACSWLLHDKITGHNLEWSTDFIRLCIATFKNENFKAAATAQVDTCIVDLAPAEASF